MLGWGGRGGWGGGGGGGGEQILHFIDLIWIQKEPLDLGGNAS